MEGGGNRFAKPFLAGCLRAEFLCDAAFAFSVGWGACQCAGLMVSPLMFQELLQKKEEEAAWGPGRQERASKKRKRKRADAGGKERGSLGKAPVPLAGPQSHLS